MHLGALQRGFSYFQSLFWSNHRYCNFSNHHFSVLGFLPFHLYCRWHCQMGQTLGYVLSRSKSSTELTRPIVLPCWFRTHREADVTNSVKPFEIYWCDPLDRSKEYCIPEYILLPSALKFSKLRAFSTLSKLTKWTKQFCFALHLTVANIQRKQTSFMETGAEGRRGKCRGCTWAEEKCTLMLSHELVLSNSGTANAHKRQKYELSLGKKTHQSLKQSLQAQNESLQLNCSSCINNCSSLDAH